jgi:hypothetical protein
VRPGVAGREVSDLGSDKIAACQSPTLPTGIAALYTATPPRPPHGRPVRVKAVMTLTAMRNSAVCYSNRVAASADSQSFLNHFRHLGIEVYPDHGAGRVAVRDRFAQRPSLLQYPGSAMFEILADLAFRNPMRANARFKL